MKYKSKYPPHALEEEDIDWIGQSPYPPVDMDDKRITMADFDAQPIAVSVGKATNDIEKIRINWKNGVETQVIMSSPDKKYIHALETIITYLEEEIIRLRG